MLLLAEAFLIVKPKGNAILQYNCKKYKPANEASFLKEVKEVSNHE